MASNKSLSEGWREKGNDSYRRVEDRLPPTIQVKRLQEAFNCYGRSLSLAADDTERSSACKNMAMAHWKMAKAQAANMGSDFIITFHYKQALSHFQDAKTFGSQHDVAWHGRLTDTAVRCWVDVSKRLEDWEVDKRVREMHQLVAYIIDDSTKARAYLKLANHYFNCSVKALADRDYKQCLTLLKDCHFPLKEAQRFGHSEPLLAKECTRLEEDVFTQLCVAESIQECMKGEALLTHVIRDEEILNIDVIWDVVDSFRMAAQLTRDRDLQIEAMAKVMKLKDRAKECLMKVLERANTMVPRNATSEPWYEFARSTIERYQQEQARPTDQELAKERKEVLTEIKAELDTLKRQKGRLSNWGFLKFVYTTHPPKNPEHRRSEVDDTSDFKQLKKLYQRALVHYHPDKVDVKEHGKQWKVLSEEIAKLLSSHYESLK